MTRIRSLPERHSPLLTAPSPPRSLRVGVVLGGRLVEERLFPLDDTPITIGQSLRCRISIPVDGIPQQHTLVEHGRLVLGPTMTGRIGHAGTDEILELGAGSHAMSQGMRAKLRLGEAVVLLQELAARPHVPRPQLPASVRGSFTDRIDPRLALTIGASIAAHTALAVFAWTLEPELDVPPPLVTEASMFEPVSIFDPPAEPAKAAATSQSGAATPAPTAASSAAPRTSPATPTAPKLPPTMSEADGARWAGIVTGATGAQGENPISRRSPGASLEQQIADIREHDRDVRAGGGNSRTRDDQARRGTTDGLNIDGQNVGPNDDKRERDPIVRLVPMPKPIGIRTPTPEMVVSRIIGSYMTGLQRCYVKHGLSVDQTLAAKVKLSFTITTHGTTEDNQATGSTADVDGCIRGLMGGWRFPIPRDEDGDVTEATFQVALMLRPS